MRTTIRSLGLAVALAACGSDAADVCVVPPCAPSTAIVLTVTSASVNAAGAPGFQTIQRTVVVGERPAPKCGCGGADTQQLAIALVPIQ